MENTAEKALAQYWDDVERRTVITTKERVVLASAHFLCTNCNQEAFLLQTDCTTRYVKQNLVNCCTIVNKVHNKPIRDQNNAVRALRSTDVCARLATRRSSRHKCGQQTRPSLNFVDAGHFKKLWEFWRSGFDVGAYVCNRHTDTEMKT